MLSKIERIHNLQVEAAGLQDKAAEIKKTCILDCSTGPDTDKKLRAFVSDFATAPIRITRDGSAYVLSLTIDEGRALLAWLADIYKDEQGENR